MTDALAREPHWFVVQTHPNCEVDAERNLREGQFFATLLPLLEKEKPPSFFAEVVMARRCEQCEARTSRPCRFRSRASAIQHLRDVHSAKPDKKDMSRTRPLFPGYIFVGFDPAERWWGSIQHTRGVSRLMCDAEGQPIRVPDWAMQQVRDTLDADNVKTNKLPIKRRWTDDLGVKFVVKDGPFAGQEGFCQKSGKRRVALLMMFMGAEREIPVRREWVQVAA